MSYQLWTHGEQMNSLSISYAVQYKLTCDHLTTQQAYDEVACIAFLPFRFPFTATNTLQPQKNVTPTAQCTLMFLKNLAEPEWLQVNCDHQLLGDILCMIPDASSQKSGSVHISADLRIFDTSCILKFGECYQFLWISSKSTRLIDKSRAKKFDVGLFLDLFDSVSAEFPPIFTQDLKQVITFNRCLNKPQVATLQKATYGFSVAHQKFSYFVNKSGNVFKCPGGSIISALQVCDGVPDCKYSRDEDGCLCDSKTDTPHRGKCKYVSLNSDENVTRCSKMFHRLRNGTCEMYKLPVQTETRVVDKHQPKIGNFPATGNSYETLFFHKMINTSQCSTNGLLSCGAGLAVCFSVSDICIYKLIQRYLLPCNNGGNLQQCEDFECNMKFKCPRYYCVRWAYVCDKKWDCPGGFDEFNCVSKTSCKNMFKCVKSETCIHVGDVCNGYPDCLEGDDENLCRLLNFACPSDCDCVSFALRCTDTGYPLNWRHNIPYFVIYVKNCGKSFVEVLLRKISVANILSLQLNRLSDVCKLELPQPGEIFILDLSFNKEKTIERNCLGNTSQLMVFHLNNNILSHIANEAFLQSNTLTYLDLSHNFLLSINNEIFSSGIKFLFLANNALSDVGTTGFGSLDIDYLFTKDDGLCCFASGASVCTARRPWYKRCSRTVRNTAQQVTLYCFTCIICVANAASIILLQSSKGKMFEKRKSFQKTAKRINFVDLSFVIYLTTLFVGDLVFKEGIVLKEKQWKSGPFCFAAFATFLNFGWLSPPMSGFLSLSRFMVVLHPLDTQFKESAFVGKTTTKIAGSVFALSTLVSIFQSHFEGITTNICFPLVDPTGLSIMIKFLVWVTVVLEFSTCIFTIVISIALTQEVKKSKNKIATATSVQKSNRPIIIQLTTLVASNIISWISSGLIFIVAMFEYFYPLDMIMWTIIIIIPFNSIVTPVVFIVTTIRKNLDQK